MLITIAIAGFLIGFSKAGVGGTLSPFVTVLVALSLPADDAIGLLLPMLVIADFFTITVHWRHWDSPILYRLLGAGVVGIAIGSLFVSRISEPMLRQAIAIAMLIFVAIYLLSKNHLVSKVTLRHAWPAGLLGGLSSALAHLGGPPVLGYLLSTNLPPRRFVATSAALFANLNLLKIPAYLLAGLFDADLIASTWWTWLAIPVGVFAGRAVVGYIDRNLFDRITTALLVGGAIILLVT